MSDFVEQCRQEWRHLGVPDPLAEEMAADLAADLSEAEAEGVSAEELLGSSFFDPSSFAATWASERGVIPEPPRPATRRRPRVLVAFTILAAITMMIAALLLLTGQPKLSLARTTQPHIIHIAAGSVFPLGPKPPIVHIVSVHSVSAAAPIELILLLLTIVALGFAAWLWASTRRSQPPTAPA
jgi:hypothetical protein